jgi:ABC-type phosphonate transport system ATPase subunit
VHHTVDSARPLRPPRATDSRGCADVDVLQPLRVVGVTGVSRSGKGTLAAALAARLAEHHDLAVIRAYPRLIVR